MNRLSSILAAAAMTLAATAAGAQTLKMTNQVVRINAYEASTSVNLVVVKPEVKLDVLDPSVFTVETNGVERVVKIVYTCDDRGEWTDGGDYLAFGLEVSRERGASPLVSRGMGTWSTAYPVKVALKSGKKIKAGGNTYTAVPMPSATSFRSRTSSAAEHSPVLQPDAPEMRPSPTEHTSPRLSASTERRTPSSSGSTEWEKAELTSPSNLWATKSWP